MPADHSDGTTRVSDHFQVRKETSMPLKEYAERIGSTFQYGLQDLFPVQSDSGFLDTLRTLTTALEDLMSCTRWAKFRVARSKMQPHVESWAQLTLDSLDRREALMMLKIVCSEDERYLDQSFDMGLNGGVHTLRGWPDEDLVDRPVFILQRAFPWRWTQQASNHYSNQSGQST